MRLSETLIDLGKPIAFYPGLVKLTGSINATLFLCQFLYWHGKGSNPDGWIYKLQTEIQEETALTIRMQEKARKELRGLGLLEEKRQGIPAQLFYRVDVKKLDILWSAHCETRSYKNADLDPTKTRIKNRQKRGASLDFLGGLYTETTAEITTETTTPPPTPQGEPEPEGGETSSPCDFFNPEPERKPNSGSKPKKIDSPKNQKLSKETNIPPPEKFKFESKSQRREFWEQMKAYKLKSDPKLSEGSADAIATATLIRLESGESRPDDETYLERFLDGSLGQDVANPNQSARLAQDFSSMMNALEDV